MPATTATSGLHHLMAAHITGSEQPEPVTLAMLAEQAEPLTEYVQRILAGTRIREELQALGEQLAEEQGIFHGFGHTQADRHAFQAVARPLLAARQRLWAQLIGQITKTLLEGKIFAFGLRIPLGDRSEHELINPVLWHDLKLDLEQSAAQATGHLFRSLRLLHPDDAGQAGRPLIRAELLRRAGDGGAAESGDEIVEVAPSAAGPNPDHVTEGEAYRKYRPPLLRAEMKRRARAGQFTWNWGADSRALVDWIKASFDHGKLPKDAESIRRTYRELYRELEREFKAGDQAG